MLHHNLESLEYNTQTEVQQMDEATPVWILRETITFQFIDLRYPLEIEVHHLYSEKLQLFNEDIFEYRCSSRSHPRSVADCVNGADVLASHLETTRSISH